MANLSKLYDRLTPAERLPMIVNACARGDRIERDRLVRTAPNDIVTQSDYSDLARRLERLAWQYATEQYRLLVLFSQATVDGHFRVTSGYAKYLAYTFAMHVDSWNRFCSERGIEPDAPIEGISGFQLLKNHEPIARHFAFTFDEARKYLSDSDSNVQSPLTVDQMVEAMNASFNANNLACD